MPVVTTPASVNSSTSPGAAPAALGWRLLALGYDLLPALALWMLLSALVLLLTPDHHTLAAFGAGQIALWLGCWLITGVYATTSWRRGGQTIGMRPWRLRLVTRDGSPPSLRALWLRYAVATLSLAAGGLGLWWALLDRQRRGWHDIAAGTLVLRLAKPVRATR